MTIPPEVTVLEGRNATNRAWFLEVVMAGHGVSRASRKDDADEGRVELECGGDSYTCPYPTPYGLIAMGATYFDNLELVDFVSLPARIQHYLACS